MDINHDMLSAKATQNANFFSILSLGFFLKIPSTHVCRWKLPDALLIINQDVSSFTVPITLNIGLPGEFVMSQITPHGLHLFNTGLLPWMWKLRTRIILCREQFWLEGRGLVKTGSGGGNFRRVSVIWPAVGRGQLPTYLTVAGLFQGCSNPLYTGSSTDPVETPGPESVCTARTTETTLVIFPPLCSHLLNSAPILLVLAFQFHPS